MTIEVRQLRYAVLTADTRSFSRAATALNMKQATLSLRVTQLEDKLGIKLFTRSTRGAEPTEMGQVFLESARRIITDIDNLQTTARAVSYGEQGRLAVGYSSSLMAGNLKQTFSEYPRQGETRRGWPVQPGARRQAHRLRLRPQRQFQRRSRRQPQQSGW